MKVAHLQDLIWLTYYSSSPRTTIYHILPLYIYHQCKKNNLLHIEDLILSVYLLLVTYQLHNFPDTIQYAIKQKYTKCYIPMILSLSYFKRVSWIRRGDISWSKLLGRRCMIDCPGFNNGKDSENVRFPSLNYQETIVHKALASILQTKRFHRLERGSRFPWDCPWFWLLSQVARIGVKLACTQKYDTIAPLWVLNTRLSKICAPLTHFFKSNL